MSKKSRILGLGTLFAVIIILITISLRSLFTSTKHDYSVLKIESLIPKMMYGINIDSSVVITDEVKRNQSLSDILTQYGVSNFIVHELASASRDQFDVRRIRAGNAYTMILSNDHLATPQYFVYEETASDYVIFQMIDTIKVSRGNKPIEKIIRHAGGVIESSLWNAMVDQGTDPNLANELSEIYAWTIDFFGIQKGDYYQVIYEDLMIDDKSIGIGNILASNFNHYGSDNYAFYFSQQDEWDYFDDRAESLRRTFLKAPLRFKRISSTFSYSRMHPVLKIRRPHTGVDYAADYGTPVLTIGEGVVTERGYDKKGGGNYLKIKHNGTYTTVYMHLQGFAKGIAVGKRVNQGDVIGYVGSTGLATGPHLDFRVYRNGKPIDPLKMESPPAKPVDPAFLDEFNIFKDSLINIVQSISVIDFSNPSSDK